MNLIHKRGPARMNANLTPMIDVTFLLIVFFVLVSQIVKVENVDLAPPELERPASELPGDEQRAVINVRPGVDGSAVAYSIGGRSFPVGGAGVERLTEHLASLYSRQPALRINLRADQRTHYVWIDPVLRAIADAARRTESAEVTPRVNLVITREEERP
jgi:biopolymer transport protein ExbD